MTHLWIRAEQRANEDRVGITPEGAKTLLDAGFRVTVERSKNRIIATDDYQQAGCEIAPENSWARAPEDAIIFGLKELPEDGTPLSHRHIMFGHAYKGQHSGRILLERFKAGGGTLYDLEYLVDGNGRRVAAFGYWAGFAGAALALKTWVAQQRSNICPSVGAYANKDQLIEQLQQELAGLVQARPSALIIGALGRVGTGACDLLTTLGVNPTKWDIDDTKNGGPFPEILDHNLFINCILAGPTTPVFVPRTALTCPRNLTAIADVACDPDSDYNPVPVYDRATSWEHPAIRVAIDPVLDVMAIDNLPSMLPLESSQDFAKQLLPTLMALETLDTGVWGRAHATFNTHIKEL